MIRKIIALTLLLCSTLSSGEAQLPFPVLMGRTRQAKRKPTHLQKKDVVELKRLTRQYKRSITLLDKEPIYHIPHQIHFIWIGPKPFPEDSIKNVQAFQTFHPDWIMNFWTDSEDRPLPIPGLVRRLVTEEYFEPIMDLYRVSTNYGEKADLLRFVIMNKEGGLYFDHDASCEKSFAPMADRYDFVAALERIQYHDGLKSCLAPAIGLFLSRPDHPILQRSIELSHLRWNTVPTYPHDEQWRSVIYRTFDSFAMATKELRAKDNSRDLLLPTAYFYANLAFKKPFLKRLNRDGYLYSVHDCDKSWR